ncbi:cytochrome c family protein [Sphingomonas paeninsulae]|uniref:Cytochrome c family protein n=2 Tax=Sphingomonas paeninsulae TaxID=2319844 RepID=A0A494TNB3_SPHPE|nr:cytochrome c family protein [Sphingomonas paeninsulae]
MKMEDAMHRQTTLKCLIAAGLLTACSQNSTSEANVSSDTPAANAVDTLSGAKFADFKGDPGAGAASFAQCKACHVIDAGVNRMGPSLHAVVGRKAGSVEGFRYSPANKASGIVWSEAKLFEFLESPRRVIPGTTMGFAGISDPQKRADIIAYLKAN